MTLVVFRTDSSDLFAPGKHPRMMRLQAKLFANDGAERCSIDTLIKPDGWTPNAGASATHGITTRQCTLYGARAAAALAVFMDMVRSADEIATWAMPFHGGIVEVEMKRLGAKPPEWNRGGLIRTCLMREARSHWNDGKAMSIEQAWDRIDGFDPMPDKMTAQIKIREALKRGGR